MKPTGKKMQNSVLKLFEKYSDKEYCAHEISAIYNTSVNSASTNLTRLLNDKKIEYAGKDICERSNNKHRFYRLVRNNKSKKMIRLEVENEVLRELLKEVTNNE